MSRTPGISGPRFTLTYGLRWDIDPPPSSLEGPSILALTGYDLKNLSNLGLAPPGTQPYSTTYGNVAPRIGIAYDLHDSENWRTVLRAGFGVFYNMASSEVGTSLENRCILSGDEVCGSGSVSFQFGSDGILEQPPTFHLSCKSRPASKRRRGEPTPRSPLYPGVELRFGASLRKAAVPFGDVQRERQEEGCCKAPLWHPRGRPI